MKVLKFGGSSVKDSYWINRALDITEQQLSSGLVVVSSAMAKTTNRLQETALLAEQGDYTQAAQMIEELMAFHRETAEALLKGENRSRCLKELERLFNELGSVIKGLALLKERTPRSNDLILSFGERLATQVVAWRARERGIKTELLDARDFMKTDDHFSQASLIEELTYSLIADKVKPSPGSIIVTQGFIASTREGTTTTLGRNQSDFTAIVIGAALKAEEVQIWTDVDGIMTVDPHVVQEASTVPIISYREAAELAHFGARVIHPSAIQPAVNHSIPVCVKNTGNPSGEGTIIVSSQPSEGPKAIAFKKAVRVINISSGRMLMAYGFLKAIFEIFEKYKTSVDLIATSEVSVSMTIDDTTHLDHILNDLASLGSVSTEGEQSIVCLVGQDLWKSSRIISRVFSTLEQVPIRMISLGSSDTNLSIVVPQNYTEDTVRSLHKEFFEKRA